MKCYFPPFVCCYNSPKSKEKAQAAAALMQLHWGTLHTIPHQMQWLLCGQTAGQLYLGHPESLHVGDAAHSLFAEVVLYFSLRGSCSSWRQPITLEDAPWLSCWQACGTGHLVLLHCEMWSQSTVHRKGIIVANKYFTPAWSRTVLILTN